MRLIPNANRQLDLGLLSGQRSQQEVKARLAYIDEAVQCLGSLQLELRPLLQHLQAHPMNFVDEEMPSATPRGPCLSRAFALLGRLWALVPDSAFPARPNRVTHVCTSVCIELLKVCESAIAMSGSVAQCESETGHLAQDKGQALRAILLSSATLANWYVRWTLMQYGQPVARVDALLRQACLWVDTLPQEHRPKRFVAEFGLQTVQASVLCAIDTACLSPAEILSCEHLLAEVILDVLVADPLSLKRATAQPQEDCLPVPSLMVRDAGLGFSWASSAPWMFVLAPLVKRLEQIAMDHDHQHGDVHRKKCARHIAVHLRGYCNEHRAPRWVEYATSGHTQSAQMYFGLREIGACKSATAATLLEQQPLAGSAPASRGGSIHDPLVKIRDYAWAHVNSSYVMDCFSGQMVSVEHAGKTRLCIVNSVRRTEQAHVLFGLDLLSETFESDQAMSLDRPWPQSRLYTQDVLVYPHESVRGSLRLVVSAPTQSSVSEELPRQIRLKGRGLRLRRNAMPIQLYRSLCLTYEVV